MAKKTTKSQSKVAKEVIEDAVATDVSEPPVDVPQAPVEEAPEVKPDPVEDVIPEPEVVVPEPEIAPEPKFAEPAPIPVETIDNRSNSVLLPLILGGVIAGGIGYAVAYLTRPAIGEDLESIVANQGQMIAELEEQNTVLETQIAALPSLAPINDAIDATQSEIANTEERIVELVAAIDTRLAVVERQPSGDGTLQDTALAAYQSDIDMLRAQIEAQQAELQQVAIDATAQLDATRAEATEIEASAIANARNATARAALARIQGALETGASLGPALADLDSALDNEIPTALTDVSDGVITLAQLQADFPASARAALATARAEGASGEETSGIGAFLRNQLDVRSVAPQEGDSVDAVLSRAEAALREGRLNDTLAEVGALPEVARAALSDWSAMAEVRAAALSAASDLSLSLNDN